MAQMSYLWTTGGAGDGAGTYSRTDWQKIIAISSGAYNEEGVVPSKAYGTLHGNDTGLNNFRVFEGAAVVDGKPYLNDAPVDIAIPSAAGAGNTRIDRVVLRADWTAQTVRITRIAGVDAATPTAPAATKTSGTTYDILLYQVLVDTTGAITYTDEREMATIFWGVQTTGQFYSWWSPGTYRQQIPYPQIYMGSVQDTVTPTTVGDTGIIYVDDPADIYEGMVFVTLSNLGTTDLTYAAISADTGIEIRWRYNGGAVPSEAPRFSWLLIADKVPV